MNSSVHKAINSSGLPPMWYRVFSVWLRHIRVYGTHFVSNALPPFLEPLIFLAGIGIGLGHYVGLIEGKTYVQFLATGIVVPSAMYTAAFECSFGTFIRLEYEKVYDGMLASSISVRDLFLGELFFAGTKGMFFSFAVLVIVSSFGLIPSWLALFVPVIGFLTGFMFGSLSLFVTSFVSTINHFSFYFTGLLTPMFFFSGIVFPIKSLPESLQIFAQALPLTHSADLVRAFAFGRFAPILWLDVLYIVVFTIVFASWAIRRLEKQLIK